MSLLPARAFTADNGLGGATITSLLKDARGFLWIGTPDELLLYDGARFHPFRYTDSSGAPQSFRRAYLFSLGPCGVFIAHEEGTHQFVLPAGGLRAVRSPFNDFHVRSSMHAEGAAPAMFRASTGAHSGRYDARTMRWTEVRTHPLPQRPAVRVMPEGKILLACDTGASARSIRIHDPASRTSPETFELPFRAACVLRLDEGTLFLEAGDGRTLWWMPAGKPLQAVVQLRQPANDICAAYAADGTCYVAAAHSLLRFHPATGTAREILREDGSPIVRSGVLIHALPDGRTLWLGSNTTGLLRVSLDGPRLRHLRADSALLNWSHGIYADLARGRIYVGGYSGTVAVFDTGGAFVNDLTPTLHRASRPRTAYINAIEPLPDGRLFFAGGTVPWVYDPATGRVENLSADMREAMGTRGLDTVADLGRRGVIRAGPWRWWTSEKEGVVLWRILPEAVGEKTRIVIERLVRIAPPATEALCRSSSGGWWCATAGRLYRFGEGGITDSFRYPIRAFATSIAEDGQGRLWIGTESGIAVWKGGATQRLITTETGLPNNHVYALIPDGRGWMWGSTNGGLFAVRTQDFFVRAFTGGEGLQGAEFNLGSAAKDARGRLYFGGMNGVNIVEPAVALREDEGSPVTILRVAGPDTVFYSYPGGASPPLLRLPHDRASLRLSFVSPQLVAAGPQRYEYRLRGSDTAWTDNGTRTELQLFLAPGDYRVEVRLRGEPATVTGFSVEVAPPFYRSWWFIAGIILLVGALVAAYISRAAQRRYRRELAALETVRRIQEEKSRISRELHDELGARAALMAHNASLLKEEAGEASPLVPLAARVSESTADMLTALRETVWTLEQEAITVESLWLRYKNFIAKLAATYGHIRFTVEEDEALPTEPLDYARALHLLRVLQEAVTNAVKHSGASAVTVSARARVEMFCFSVADDGRGFDVESERVRGEGNGLYNMEHRSAEAALRLNIRSVAEHGTLVEVCI